MNKSKGHVALINGFEYFKVDNRLFRAETSKPVVDGKRPGEFVTSGSGVAFALRMARLAVGERER